jgi:hypothetical protein
LEKLLLHASTSLATLTGVVFLVMKHLMTSADPFSVIHHPLQPYALDLHVLVGPVVVFAIGLIAREHILGRFLEGRPHRSRGAGIGTILLAAPMVASGYLLQVATGTLTRQALVVAHVATGALFALCLAVHLLSARGSGRLPGRADGGTSPVDAAPALIGSDREV